MQNFSFPYFSRDIAEFWRRWHISLSTWFRDYLYIPLGGSRGGTNTKIRNTFIIFIVSGFWHGANWTFIIWGALNALYFLPLLLLNKNRKNMEFTTQTSVKTYLINLFKTIITFSLTCFAWIFFRAESLNHALDYISNLFTKTILLKPEVLPIQLILILSTFIFIEWKSRHKEHVLANIHEKYITPLRWGLYFIIILGIVLLADEKQEFIYFQF